MSYLTSVAIPEPVIKRAKQLGINISGTARAAVIAEVKKKEEESRGQRRQAISPGNQPNDSEAI